MTKRERNLLLVFIMTVSLWLPASGSDRREGPTGEGPTVRREDSDVETVDPTLAIVGGWLIDGTGHVPYGDAVVLIAGNRIKAVGRRGELTVPPQITVIDARGKTILPGIIDAHNHLEGVGLGDADAEFTSTPEKLKQVILQNAQLDLLSGVTTIRDLGSSEMVLELREQVEAVGPRLFAAGPQFVKRDPTATPNPNFIEFDDPRDAKRKVREQIAKGVNVIKVRLPAQRALPSLKEIEAIVEEAHRGGVKVAVHTDVPFEAAVRLAVKTGIDTLEHSAALRVGDDLLLREIGRKNLIVVPTLFQMQAQQMDVLIRSDEELIESPLAERLPPEWLQALRQRAAAWRKTLDDWRGLRGYDALRALRQALNSVARAQSLGVKMAIGPDTGSDLVPHGRIYRDLEFYANAGLQAMDVIQMYTRNAAEALGKEKELGTIEPGKFADIILVEGDPLLDITAFRNVVQVIKGGKVIELPRASQQE
jgi:imidazolonepropionase-like amidohydrolase